MRVCIVWLLASLDHMTSQLHDGFLRDGKEDIKKVSQINWWEGTLYPSVSGENRDWLAYVKGLVIVEHIPSG